MSNLLRPKKKPLLDRGPKIEPQTSFSLDEEKNINPVELKKDDMQEQEVTAEVKVTSKQKKPGRPKVIRDDQVTSVRLMKSTRSKLNALVQLGKAENVDVLMDTLVQEYIRGLPKDEKRIYQIVFETFNKK